MTHTMVDLMEMGATLICLVAFAKAATSGEGRKGRGEMPGRTRQVSISWDNSG